MKYKGIIAYLNGAPDSAGDILGTNVRIPKHSVKVTNNFEGTSLGRANIRLEGNTIVADIEIDPSVFPPELVESMCGVVGGSITSRVGCSIDSWDIKDVGLTYTPADKSLPKLKRVV